MGTGSVSWTTGITVMLNIVELEEKFECSYTKKKECGARYASYPDAKMAHGISGFQCRVYHTIKYK